MFSSLAVVFFLGFETKVQDLIEQMDNPNFQTREEAVKSVASFGRFSVPGLKKSSIEHRSKEVRYGCKKALEIIYRSDYYTVYPTRYPRYKMYPRLDLIFEFFRDTFFPNRAEQRKNSEWARSFPISWNRADGYLREAKGKTKKDAPRFEHERLATRMYVRDLLDAGMSRKDVLHFVNELTEVERRWYQKYAANVPPELKSPPVKK